MHVVWWEALSSVNIFQFKSFTPPLSKIFQKEESEQLPAAGNLADVFDTHGTIFPVHQRKISLFIKYVN